MKKIKTHIRIIVALAILLTTTMACNDWLSLTPENDLIKEKFWTRTADAESALAASYNAFRDAVVESYIWGELRADLITFSGTQFDDYNNIAASNITANNSRIRWNKYYNAINLANTLMYFMDEVAEKDNSFTPRMQQAFEAEALFIRSLSYFYLVRIWKEVPLVLEASTTDQGDLFLPKSTEKEILNQIIADLLKAKDLAYVDEFRNRPEYYKGRANKYSIMALLADVYLWNEQYQECISYCDSIIMSGRFELENYIDWFRLYYPGNSMKESIFEIQFDDNYESQNNPMHNDLFPISGTIRVRLNTVNTTTLMNRNDLRMIGTRAPTWKYVGINTTTSTRRSGNQRDANVIYYRYADVLLMKAEALTELGTLNEANAYLRLIVERAGLTHLEILNQNELRKAVLDERGREFIAEGKRWFDLLRAAKRNHFENRQIIINMILSGADIKQQAVLRTRVFDTMSYYLPIPENDLLYNNNLVQNPFYDR